MKQQFYKKINRHTKGLFPALLIMVVLPMLLNGAYEGIAKTYDRVMPVSSYFVYNSDNPVVPTKDTFEYGEPLLFKSNSVYLKAINMRWEDTLYCFDIMGNERTYKTQIWEQKVTPLTKSDAAWAYTEEYPEPYNSPCQVCGTVIGETLSGVKKIYRYCTQQFNIQTYGHSLQDVNSYEFNLFSDEFSSAIILGTGTR